MSPAKSSFKMEKLMVVFTMLLLLLLAGTVSAQQKCLGGCYDNSTCDGDRIDADINCSECIDSLGGYWNPYTYSGCFNTTPHDLCLSSCVECCDGIDNDGDDRTDFPEDSDCTCGLDPSESEKLPPIPELSTFLLLGAGLLALAGYFVLRKRRNEG